MSRFKASRHAIVLTAIMLTGGTVGGAIVYADSISAPELAPVPANAQPGPGARSLMARTLTKRGEIGVLVYTNNAGQRCIAAGRPNGNQVGAMAGSSFRAAPLEEVGLCNPRLDPVAFQIMHSRSEVTIFGLAADNIEKIEVTVGSTTASARPTADDAFILSIPRSVTGNWTLAATSRAGETRTVPLPLLPDLDQLTEDARRNAPPLQPTG